MTHIEIEIEGMTPLLLHRFTEDAALAVDGGKTTGGNKGKKKSRREVAHDHAYFMPDGKQLCVPAENIFSALVASGIFQKDGRSKLTTAKSSLVPGFLTIFGLNCGLFDLAGKPLQKFEVSSKRVVNPNTGIPAICHRPMMDEWRLRFEVEIDTEDYSEDVTRKLVDDCGRKIGIGSFRPSKKGPFGKFRVIHWTSRPAEDERRDQPPDVGATAA